MTRIDDLFHAERERQEGVEVRATSFDALRTRGARRRMRRRAVGVAGAAVVATVVVLGGQAVVGRPDVSTLPGPALSPEPAPTTPPPAPVPPPVPVPPEGTDRAAPSPDPVLLDLVVAPDDEDVRAALWQRCARRCEGGRFELQLTRDGFATSSVVPLPGADSESVVTPLGDGAFHLSELEGSRVVRVNGSSAPVSIEGGPGPLGDGEVFVRSRAWGGRPLGLDPSTGSAHPLAVPQNLVNLDAQPDGTFLGWTWSPKRGARVVWSSDSGRTWRERVLVARGSALLQVLPSARPGTFALAEGGDGATHFPLERVHRSADGGETWETVELPEEPRAYLGTGGIDVDGHLVVDVVEWSGGSSGRGVHVSDGWDWSSLSLTHRHPEGGHRDLWMVATDVALEVRSIVDGVGVLDVSTDAGETWRRLSAG